jgi:hypothetical protein
VGAAVLIGASWRVLAVLVLVALVPTAGASLATAGEWLPAEFEQLFPHQEVALQSAVVAVRVNGVPLWWSACESQLAPGPLLKSLAPRWQRAAAPDGPGNWWVYTAQSGTRLHTLQLRMAPGGGSSGFCSVLDAATRPRSAARPPLALPPGARIDSVIEQLDASARSTQFIGTASAPPARWQALFLRLAQHSGWSRVNAGAAPPAGELLALARTGEQLEVLVLPGAAGSRFVLNQHPVPGARP